MNDVDQTLAARIRAILRHEPGYSEKKMFGGIGFFIHGNMAVGPWQGSLIVRLPKEDHDDNQRLRYATPMDVTGKVMRGWVKVLPEGIAFDEDLETWVMRAVTFVRSLPEK